MARAGVKRRFKAGSTIIEEGVRSENLFILPMAD